MIGERAVIVELRVETVGPHVVPVAGSARFHFLDLNGLGIRDLLLDGPDLLVLAGMTMHRQGVAGLLRWVNATGSSETDLVPAAALKPLMRFQTAPTGDGPEAICLLPPAGGSRRLLVVRDSPLPQRVNGSTYLAEVYAL